MGNLLVNKIKSVKRENKLIKETKKIMIYKFVMVLKIWFKKIVFWKNNLKKMFLKNVLKWIKWIKLMVWILKFLQINNLINKHKNNKMKQKKNNSIWNKKLLAWNKC